MRVLPDGVPEKRFAVVMESRPAPVGHDTEIRPLVIHTHHAAVTTAEEMKLDAAIQCRGRAKVRLECDVTVASRRLASESRAPRRHRMTPIGADDALPRTVASRVGEHSLLRSYFMNGLILENLHPAGPRSEERR